MKSLSYLFIVAMLPLWFLFPAVAISGEPLSTKRALFLVDTSQPIFTLDEVYGPGDTVGGEKTAKSRQKDAKPFLLSVLIPGAGQYYNGDKRKAAIFFGVELALWGMVYGLNVYSDGVEKDYRAYAVFHAGIDLAGKDHQYYVDIGNYLSREQYNDRQQIERDYESLYLDSEDDWQWDSDNDRVRFKDLRIRSDTVKNSVFFVSGAIVLNHLISGIEAAKSADKRGVSAGVSAGPNGIKMLTIIKEF